MKPRLTTNNLSYARLHELLNYDPITGKWTWKKYKGPKAPRGSIAGSISKTYGYRYIRIDQIGYRSNRLAFLYMLGYFPEHEAEHRNRIKHDDTWSNLREATHQCNLRNTGNPKNNTSGIKGITWDKTNQTWQARVMVNKRNRHLGRYKSFDNAVCARLAGEQCVGWAGCDSSSPAFKYVKRMLND
jgi:hypothetical protein